MAAKEGEKIDDCEFFPAGDVGQPGDKVPRGTIAVLSEALPMDEIPAGQSGRLQLARWIADERNPLTARVLANRVWNHLFGVGLVDTPDNFGIIGSRPTHPQLLDHLALEFVENGWSLKNLIRTTMLSRAYRLSSDHAEASYALDSANQLLWRMNPRRLEGEAIRDSLLQVAGKLNLAQLEGSIVSEIGTFEMKAEYCDRLRNAHTEGNYRSVYLPVVRAALPDMMKVFDAADPSLVVGQRDRTTVAPQALFLMNDAFVRAQAKLAAERLLTTESSGRTAAAFRLMLGRDPQDSERQMVAEMVKSAAEDDPLTLWTDICHGLIASGEFRTVY